MYIPKRQLFFNVEQLPRNKGKGNVLCNGPRRKYYTPNGLYTMGCNFPPVAVDATSIIDREVINTWVAGKAPMLTNTVVLNNATTETVKQNRKYFAQNTIHILGTFNVLRNYYSSGHWAAFAMIKLGFTDLDIYGCDSWWDIDIGSYTDNFIEKGKPNYNPKFVGEWRKSWDRLAREEGKGCAFNFIDRIEEDGTVVKETLYYDRKTQFDP